ncbi:restriction endonuclease subunit S [Akkermansiaceae bacterium]|nr:restriction endonuclease subunit S [Akkermansiaceae bacterium]
MSKDITSDVWLGGHPNTWRRTRIKRVCEFSPSFSSGKPDADEECTVCPMETISELGAIDAGKCERFDDVTPGLTLFEPKDVLFAKITPCMENGKGAYVETLPTRYAFGSTEFHVLRPSHEADGKFLYYYTFNPTFRAWAEKNMHGAAGQQRVSARFLKYTHLPLPPIDEQKRIAAYLDASCEAIDRAIKTKRQQLDTLDALRKSIITPAVLKGVSPNPKMRQLDNAWLKEIPSHWKCVSLKRLSDNHAGLTLGKTYEGILVSMPYLRAANVQDGFVDLRQITHIEVPPEIVEKNLLLPGDVLMTEGGDLDKLGRGCVWRGEIDPCMHQNHVHAVRCHKHRLLPDFLAYVTSSQHGRDYFEATGKKTTNLASTNSTKVGLLPIPLPPIEEQKEIVQYIDQALTDASRIRDNVVEQISTLTTYRKVLIHECVTGKRQIAEADIAKLKAKTGGG